MASARFGLDQTRRPTWPSHAGSCKRTPSTSRRGGKPCAAACAAQGFRSMALRHCTGDNGRSWISGAGTYGVVADAFGMHLELLALRDHGIHAVEQALVERRKRIGCSRLI